MLVNNRVIFSDNETLNDLSKNLNDLFANNETLAFVNGEDKLYLASDLPFNHRYFKINTANDQASNVSVKIYTGDGWTSVAEVFDRTSSSGASLGQSGIIEWSLDKNTTWQKRDTDEITELSNLKIYGMYWAQLDFSSSLAASTAIDYIGHRFSNDSDLAGRYPDLNRSNVKTAFESGKTEWINQEVLAAEEIIRDLVKMHKLRSPSQILSWEIFNLPSIHKTAEIIMNSFGEDWESRRDKARDAYEEAMDLDILFVDKDQDGHLDDYERVRSYGLVRR